MNIKASLSAKSLHVMAMHVNTAAIVTPHHQSTRAIRESVYSYKSGQMRCQLRNHSLMGRNKNSNYVGVVLLGCLIGSYQYIIQQPDK